MEYKPQKLTAFYFKPTGQVSENKDGAGLAALWDSYTDLPDGIPEESSSPDFCTLHSPP